MDEQQIPMQGEETAGEGMTADTGAQGYCIEIYVNGDGSFSVSKEPMAQEMGEGEAAGQPAQSFTDALKMAVQIYQDNPVGQDDAEAFDSGFNSVRG